MQGCRQLNVKLQQCGRYALGRPRRGASYQLFVLPEQRTPNTCPSNVQEQIHAYLVGV